MKKLQEGRLYRVDFLDHSMGHRKLFLCKVVGWLVHQDSQSLTLAAWDVEADDPETRMLNQEVFTIGKGMVKRVRLLG